MRIYGKIGMRYRSRNERIQKNGSGGQWEDWEDSMAFVSGCCFFFVFRKNVSDVEIQNQNIWNIHKIWQEYHLNFWIAVGVNNIVLFSRFKFFCENRFISSTVEIGHIVYVNNRIGALLLLLQHLHTNIQYSIYIFFLTIYCFYYVKRTNVTAYLIQTVIMIHLTLDI